MTYNVLSGMLSLYTTTINISSWWHGTMGRTSVFHRMTICGMRHDVLLTGDIFGVNRLLYVSKPGQLSHLLGVDK